MRLFTEIQQDQACHVIVVTTDLLYRKGWFAAYLARYLPYVVLCLLILTNCSTPVTEVLLVLWHLVQSITRQMKTRVAHVAVKNLIGVRIKTTKTYLAICLKKLLACNLTSFGGFCLFHIVQKLFYHLVCLILRPILNVPQNGKMH